MATAIYNETDSAYTWFVVTFDDGSYALYGAWHNTIGPVGRIVVDSTNHQVNGVQNGRDDRALLAVRFELFRRELQAAFVDLFQTPEYANAVAKKTTPEDYARTYTTALAKGSANKDGAAVKRACKALRLPVTFKAIQAFLRGDLGRGGAGVWP